jgi:hypothetical protein
MNIPTQAGTGLDWAYRQTSLREFGHILTTVILNIVNPVLGEPHENPAVLMPFGDYRSSTG